MNPQENEATSEIHNSGLISASIAWCVPFTTRSPQACYLLLECYSLFDFQIILHAKTKANNNKNLSFLEVIYTTLSPLPLPSRLSV